jgi:hypothetical protein
MCSTGKEVAVVVVGIVHLKVAQGIDAMVAADQH